MISVVGGVYYEWCMHPAWDELFGSGGRAASAIAALGGKAALHSCFDDGARAIMESRAALEGFTLEPSLAVSSVRFGYQQPLAAPRVLWTSKAPTTPNVSAQNIVQFGMIDADVIVEADRVVYDPQSAGNPRAFHASGSSAKHLALVLNRFEAWKLSGVQDPSPEQHGRALLNATGAEVVVIKMGPRGALVCDRGGTVAVPPYRTANVWKIGSGDVFVASFAYFWMEAGLCAADAAVRASQATAYYCQTRGFASIEQLEAFCRNAIVAPTISDGKDQPLVYLAGPFFTLPQRWMIEQARDALCSMNLSVFSPFHDVGLGRASDVVGADLAGLEKCHAVFAIGDGLDSGTVYEIGYARALKKPVVFYCENVSVEDRKMMEGSDCKIVSDFTTAVYETFWACHSS